MHGGDVAPREQAKQTRSVPPEAARQSDVGDGRRTVNEPSATLEPSWVSTKDAKQHRERSRREHQNSPRDLTHPVGVMQSARRELGQDSLLDSDRNCLFTVRDTEARKQGAKGRLHRVRREMKPLRNL